MKTLSVRRSIGSEFRNASVRQTSHDAKNFAKLPATTPRFRLKCVRVESAAMVIEPSQSFHSQMLPLRGFICVVLNIEF